VPVRLPRSSYCGRGQCCYRRRSVYPDETHPIRRVLVNHAPSTSDHRRCGPAQRPHRQRYHHNPYLEYVDDEPLKKSGGATRMRSSSFVRATLSICRWAALIISSGVSDRSQVRCRRRPLTMQGVVRLPSSVVVWLFPLDWRNSIDG